MNSLLILVALVAIDPSSPEWKGSKEEAAALARLAKEEATGISFRIPPPKGEFHVGDVVPIHVEIRNRGPMKYEGKTLFITKLAGTDTQDAVEYKIEEAKKPTPNQSTVIDLPFRFKRTGRWTVLVGLYDAKNHCLSHSICGITVK